jgi:hypothetical protein
MDIPNNLLSGPNSCEYLYLREVSEPAANRLRVVAEEAGAAPKLTSRELGGLEFSDLRAIESSEASRLFEITWESYVAYGIRNESFTVLDEYEEIEFGRLARVYSKSRFLDYVASATIATFDYLGPFRHIGLICLNHVVDVVSTSVPKIRELRNN